MINSNWRTAVLVRQLKKELSCVNANNPVKPLDWNPLLLIFVSQLEKIHLVNERSRTIINHQRPVIAWWIYTRHLRTSWVPGPARLFVYSPLQHSPRQQINADVRVQLIQVGKFTIKYKIGAKHIILWIWYTQNSKI